MSTSKPDEELQFISLPSAGADGASLASGGTIGPNGGAQERSDGLIGGVMREAKHPMACLFHVLFKALSLCFYMFGGWFTSNEVFMFVMIIVSLACDFWTVKVSSALRAVPHPLCCYVNMFARASPVPVPARLTSRIFCAADTCIECDWPLARRHAMVEHGERRRQ